MLFFKRLFLLLIFFWALPLFGQPTHQGQPSDNETKNMFWLTLGGGVIGPGIGGDLKATYAWGYKSISAKFETAAPLNIFNSSTVDQINEFGLYYGVLDYGNFALGRIAAGPSYYTGRKNGQTIHDFGIGAEAEAMLKLELIGLSLMVNGMASPKFFYMGVVLNISVGKLN